jgi:glycyl-tRNA synthetase
MQIGKAYRNEISPRQSLIRLREFTMAEVEIFVDPAEKCSHPRFAEIEDRLLNLVPQQGEAAEMTVNDAVRRGIIANQYLGYHLARVDQFLEGIGIPRPLLHFRQHQRDEMAHYATDCWDAEFLSEKYGWMEIVGIADRGNYDLAAHATSLHLELQVQTESGKVVPHVIEPSFGLDRIIYALLESAFYEEEVDRETRRVLRFKPEIAPIQVAVFPLLNRDELKSKALAVFEQLRAASFFVEYDTSGSIGKRYRRQDEIGTPYCVTIDYQTLEDETVTVRERDTMKQVRVPLSALQEALR